MITPCKRWHLVGMDEGGVEQPCFRPSTPQSVNQVNSSSHPHRMGLPPKHRYSAYHKLVACLDVKSEGYNFMLIVCLSNL